MSSFADVRGYDLLMGRWSKLLGRELVRFAGIADGARILDVGCGIGSFDVRARFETGDAQRLTFPDGAFDCTTHPAEPGRRCDR